MLTGRPFMSDRSDCFRMGENVRGERAIYARFAFSSGELVYTVRGKATPERTRDSIEIGPGQHVEDPYALCLNHSFTPNLRLEERRMFALQNIAVGEELTFNYLETESEIASPFVCHDTDRPVDSNACKG